jgi:signal transduction histidine kinase
MKHTSSLRAAQVCQHAVDTLNDMLDVAKMEHGTYLPKTEIVDLGELCHKAASLQGPRLRRGVRLIMEVPPSDEAFVLSDRVLLLQV